MAKTIKFTLTPEGKSLSEELCQALALLNPKDNYYKSITELMEWLKRGSSHIRDSSCEGRLCIILSILEIYSRPERTGNKVVSETFRKLHDDFFELSMSSKIISVDDA